MPVGSLGSGTLSGVVKNYNSQKGYGFIVEKTTGKELWFHRKAVIGIGRSLEAGDKVWFHEGFNDRDGRPKAINVTVSVTGVPSLEETCLALQELQRDVRILQGQMRELQDRVPTNNILLGRVRSCSAGDDDARGHDEDRCGGNGHRRGAGVSGRGQGAGSMTYKQTELKVVEVLG